MTPAEPGHDGTIPVLQIWDLMEYHSPPAPLLPCFGDSSPSAITGTSSPCQAAHFGASLVYSALNVHIPGATQLHNHQNQHGTGGWAVFLCLPSGSGRSKPWLWPQPAPQALSGWAVPTVLGQVGAP